ncbi:hypothetical protein ACFX2I_025872 [Malus domestica]
MEVAFQPSPALLCHRQSRLPSTSSFSPANDGESLNLFNYKGFSIGCSLGRWPIFGNLSHSARHRVFCIRGQNGGLSWCDFDAKEKIGRSCYDIRLHKQHRLTRYTVLRSAAGADYPFPEPNMVSKLRGIGFCAVTAFNAIYLFVLMLILHPLVLLLDRYKRKAHIFIAKVWATTTVTPFVRIKYEGLENLPSPDTPAVYVSNHQSFLDIYILFTIGRPFKFISKTSIFLYPVIGWAMFLMGVIPLKRMDSKSQLECLKRCIELINKGASVFFFPEGTRSKDGTLGAFKRGAFSVAAKTKVPVVPITLIGTGKIMPPGREDILNTGAVKVVIHKPIEGHDTEVLCSETRNVIAGALDRQG